MTGARTPGARRWFRRSALVATAAGVVLAVTATSAVAATTDGFNPGPERLIDTRIDLPDRPAGQADGFLQTQLPDSVADGDSALLSVTVVDPTTSGFIKVYADGNPFPATSDVNFVAGATVAQAVLVEAAPDATGKIDLFIGGNSAPIDLVVDVVGSFPAASYTSLTTAVRTFDTRAPAVNTTAGKKGTGIYQVALPAGENGIPDDAQAVAVTVTQVGAEGSGYVAALTDGVATGTSSVNYTSSSINSNLVFVKPNNGRIFLQVSGAPTDLIVDVKGYTLSQAVTAQSPERTFDSRTLAGGGLLGPNTTVDIPLTANAPEGADFAILNVTSTESTFGGYLASYQAQGQQLQTSNLNWQPGQNVAGFVLAPITDGKAQIYIGVGATKVVADIEGYVVNTPTDN